MKIKRVDDYKPSPIESFKGNWGLYEVTVELEDGSFKQGSMQGDAPHGLWAFETFEEN